MTTIECIKSILGFIPQIRKINAELDEKFGIDRSAACNPFDEKEIDRAFKKNDAEEKLKKHLASLDYDILLRIETILYFGRDKEEDIALMLEYFSKLKDSKAEIIRTITEKIPACEIYFARAISKANRIDIDLNSI